MHQLEKSPYTIKILKTFIGHMKWTPPVALLKFPPNEISAYRLKKKKNLSKFSSKHICPTFCRSSPITPRRPHDSLFVPVLGTMFFFWSPNCFAAYVNGTSLPRENQTNLTILMRNENIICSLLNCFQTEDQSDLKHSHWSGISKLIMKQIWWDINSF